MSNRYQGLDKLAQPESGNKITFRIYNSLFDLAKEVGLSTSDIADVEQVILSKFNDVEQLLTGMQALYQKLDLFNPTHDKLADLYVKLGKIIREASPVSTSVVESTSGDTVPSPSRLDLTLTSSQSMQPDMQERLTKLLDDIRVEMKGRPEEAFDISKRLSQFAELIEQRSDWKTLLNAAEGVLDQTHQIESYLRKLRDGLDREYKRDIALYSELERLMAELNSQLQKDTRRGVRLWLETYAFCLSEWRLDRCSALAKQVTGLPEIILQVYASALDHLIQGNYTPAEIEQMLKHLIDRVQAEDIVEELTLAKLNILLGRIFLYHRKNPEAALSLFQAALELAPHHELPHAALGEYYLIQTDLSQAEAKFKKGLEQPPDLVDSYLGMGRLQEQLERWEQAFVWYDQAADLAMRDADPVVFLGKLLAPANGSAYLRLARKLAADQPEHAFRAVSHAIALGVIGKLENPTGQAHRLKAEILEKLGRIEEAIDAFSDAASYFSDGDTPFETESARACYEIVIRLDSKRLEEHWRLADTYLSLSYGAADDVGKRSHIERGIEVWNAGAALSLPDLSFYWAYAARSGLADQQAVLVRGEARTKRYDRWWQSAALMERLLLIKETRALDWAFLARSFDKLYLYENALQASQKAFELNSDSVFVTEWRMFALCNTGLFDQALEMIDHRLKLADDAWIHSIRAWVRLHQGRYSEAKEEIERIYQKSELEKLSLWDLQLRASIYKRTKDVDLARQNWEEMYRRKDEQDADNLSQYADAAFGLGREEEAIRLLQTPSLLEDPVERSSVLRDLGFYQIIANQTEPGWKNIEEGIAQGREVRSLNYFLQEATEALPAESIERIRKLVQARVMLLERPRTCEEELQDAYTIFGAHEGDHTWTRVGIQASLARHLGARGDWLQAAQIYFKLLLLRPFQEDQLKPFPEAEQALAICMQKIEQLGDEAYKSFEPKDAIERYEEALDLYMDGLHSGASKESATWQAVLHTKLAICILDRNDLLGARDQLIDALKIYRPDQTAEGTIPLADAIRQMLRNGEHFWMVHDFLTKLAQDSDMPPEFRTDIKTLVPPIFQFLEDYYHLKFNEYERSPFLPIILDIGEALIPADTSTERWSLFTKIIPGMRERIKTGMGVTLPHLRVRPLSGPGAGSSQFEIYKILLEEVLVAEGRTRLDRKFCPHPEEELVSAGVPSDELEPGTNPRLGATGYWLDEEQAGKAAEHGLQVWFEPLEYAIRHLEAVLRDNLADFLGIQDVENMFWEWEKIEKVAPLLQTTLSDQDSRLRFARVLRALVREGVPVNRPEEILETVQNVGLDGDLGEVVRAIRLRLKDLLPGNQPGILCVDLPPMWEEKAVSWLKREGERTFFVVPPEEANDFLQAIQELPRIGEGDVVLVTGNPEVRPFVRRLVEANYPHLIVSSQEELLSGGNLPATRTASQL